MSKKRLSIVLASVSLAVSFGGMALAADGEAVYNKVCIKCHKSGVMGAPKLGDKSAWAARIAKGKNELYKNVLEGFSTMPPKGGEASLSDDDVKAAVDYLVKAAQ